MATTKVKQTSKQVRIAGYNDIITRNKAKFKAGKSLTRKEFVALFNIPNITNKGSYKKVHLSNLRLVRAQTEINALMRENGLYLSSKDYYNEFYVRDKNYTKSVIERMSSGVDVNTTMASRMESSMTARVGKGTWGSYNKVPAKTVKNMQVTSVPTARHQQVIQRIKQL